MPTTTQASFLPFLRDYWLLRTPAFLWKTAGARWKMIEKRVNNGWTGDGQIQFPSADALPAAGSSDYALAWANSAPSGQIKWAVTKNERWQVMKIDWFVMELSASEQTSYFRSRAWEQRTHMQRYMNLMSYFCYGNGGGAVGRLRTGFAPSGQTVLPLENPRTAQFFEVGDKIVFSADDGTGGAGIRPVEPSTITEVDTRAGTVTVAVALSASILAQDYLFYPGDYGNSFKGVTAWTPLAPPTATPFFGVNRAERPDRRAGTRVPFPSGTDPYTVFTDAMDVALSLGLQINRITVPPAVIRDLMQSMAGKGTTFTPIMTPQNGATLQVGVQGYRFAYPGFDQPITFVCDRYWELPDQPFDGTDGLWLFEEAENDVWFTTKSGMSWKNFADTQGPLQQIQATQVLAASFGQFGQGVLRDTANRMIAGPDTVVS